jgi:hypothetical protein
MRQFPILHCYLVLLRPKYPPQHPILEHPQPMFLPQCDRPGFTPSEFKSKPFWLNKPAWWISLFLWWRAPQQILRTHRSLKAYCATLWWRWRERWLVFFLFFQVMEQRWNETDRGKPKYSGKNLSQCHFVHHKSHLD